MNFRYSHTMNQSGLRIIIFIVVAALIGWLYVMPAFDRVSELRAEQAIWQEKLIGMERLSGKLAELKKKYDSMVSDANKIAQAVPQQEDIAGLLVRLEELSSQSGLILDNINFTVPEAKKKGRNLAANEEEAGKDSALAPVSGVKTLVANLSLNGSYDSLRSFLKAVEDNLRVMDVATISFDVKEGVAGQPAAAGQNFNVSFNTYFR